MLSGSTRGSRRPSGRSASTRGDSARAALAGGTSRTGSRTVSRTLSRGASRGASAASVSALSLVRRGERGRRGRAVSPLSAAGAGATGAAGSADLAAFGARAFVARGAGASRYGLSSPADSGAGRGFRARLAGRFGSVIRLLRVVLKALVRLDEAKTRRTAAACHAKIAQRDCRVVMPWQYEPWPEGRCPERARDCASARILRGAQDGKGGPSLGLAAIEAPRRHEDRQRPKPPRDATISLSEYCEAGAVAQPRSV